jgi:hypothetical protein
MEEKLQHCDSDAFVAEVVETGTVAVFAALAAFAASVEFVALAAGEVDAAAVVVVVLPVDTVLVSVAAAGKTE